MIKKGSFFILLMGSIVFAEAADQHVVMEIEGMTCPLCSLAVEKSLSAVEGVRDVEVSFEENKAWVIVEESVSDNILIKAVQKAGPYKGKGLERRSKEQPEGGSTMDEKNIIVFSQTG